MTVSDEESIVIMLGFEPTSYVIPDFPASYRFIRPTSNLFQTHYETHYAINMEIEGILKNSAFTSYVLYSKVDQNLDINQALEWLNLNIDNDNCTELITNISNDLVLCKVED